MATSPETSTSETLLEELTQHRKQVDVTSYDMSLRELVRMFEDHELDLAPAYQRRFRWGLADESRLIESLLLGLPVPSIFVASNRIGTWDIVDGLQRLSTVIHFLSTDEKTLDRIGKDAPLGLEGLDKLESFNGVTYAELPASIQLRFPRSSFRVIELTDKSDYDVRFELFDRLNRGGIALSNQEVRACIFRGPFNDLVESLAEEEEFGRLIKLQETKQNDGTLEELVVKYFAYTYSLVKFKGAVAKFLNDFMKRQLESPSFDWDVEAELFRKLTSRLAEIVSAPLLREGVHTTPLNQAEAILVAAGHILRAGREIHPPPNDWLNDPDLVKFSTKGTNTVSYVHGRIRRAIELLSGGATPEELDVEGLRAE